MSIEELTIYPAVKLEILLEEFENGARPKGGVGQIEKGVPSLGGEHLTANGGFRFENIRYIPEKFFQRLKKGIIRHQDILIVKDGATTGKVAFVRQDFPFERAAINEHLFRLRAKPDLVEPEYLFWFLFSEWGQVQIQQSFQGAAIGGINHSFVKRVVIPLPPLPEQRRIVAILRKVDELHWWRQRANQRARDLLPALFYEMFGDPEDLTKMGWPVEPLGSFSEISYGLSDKLDTSLKTNEGTRIITISNVTIDGEIDLSIERYTNVAGRKAEKAKVRKYDILFNWRSGSEKHVGKTAIWEFDFAALHVSFLLKIRVNSNKANPYYLWALLNILRSRGFFKASARSQVNVKFNASEMAALQLPLPPISLQNKFTQVVMEIRKSWRAQEGMKHHLEYLSSTLLSRAFTGELTAAWREAHADELRAAAEKRDRLLAQQQKAEDISIEVIGDFQAIAAAMRELTAAANKIVDAAIQPALSGFTRAAEALRPNLALQAEDINEQLLKSMASWDEEIKRQWVAVIPSWTDILRDKYSQEFADLAEKIAELARLQMKEPISRREVEDRVLAVAQSKESYLTLSALAADWRLNHFPRQTIQEAVDMLVFRGKLRPVTLRVETGASARPNVFLSAYALVREEDKISADEINL